MPIFKCSQCGVVDNTAISRYWSWVHYFPDDATDVSQMQKRDPLCSQCNPEIGKWHGEFERQTPEQMGVVEGPDGFLHDPNDRYYKQLIREKEEKEGKKKC